MDRARGRACAGPRHAAPLELRGPDVLSPQKPADHLKPPVPVRAFGDGVEHAGVLHQLVDGVVEVARDHVRQFVALGLEGRGEAGLGGLHRVGAARGVLGPALPQAAQHSRPQPLDGGLDVVLGHLQSAVPRAAAALEGRVAPGDGLLERVAQRLTGLEARLLNTLDVLGPQGAQDFVAQRHELRPLQDRNVHSRPGVSVIVIHRPVHDFGQACRVDVRLPDAV
mmetsp:Transcript_56609/g.100902  ORF Transcript_56609/g.100902 Transcript_56609/m.100902 type:complete len:224 (+) Transcript_56609:1489-2160(+)